MKTMIKNTKRLASRILLFSTALMSITLNGMAQNGKSAITKAASDVTEYFETGQELMYAIGAVIGLIGAIKVYSKWNSGDQDTSKVAASWFGSCIFLVLVATVIRAFFL